MTLFELENQFKMANSIDELNQILKQFLLSLKITTYSFTYYSYYPNSLNKVKYDICSPNFLSWHTHYLNQHYEEIDSTLEQAYQATLPVFWDIRVQLKEAKSDKEKQMRLDSIEFGAIKGLSIPIHGPNEDFAILLIVQMREENCLDAWKRLQYSLFSVGYCYYTYLNKLLIKNQKPIAKFNLQARELQCLTLIAKNYSTKTIAKNLNITERTVNYHIQRLNKKLGTKNKYQSAAKALQLGIIKL